MQSYLSTPSSKTGVSIASNNRTKSAKVLEGRLKTKKLESAMQGRESFLCVDLLESRANRLCMW